MNTTVDNTTEDKQKMTAEVDTKVYIGWSKDSIYLETLLESCIKHRLHLIAETGLVWPKIVEELQKTKIFSDINITKDALRVQYRDYYLINYAKFLDGDDLHDDKVARLYREIFLQIVADARKHLREGPQPQSRQHCSKKRGHANPTVVRHPATQTQPSVQPATQTQPLTQPTVQPPMQTQPTVQAQPSVQPQPATQPATQPVVQPATLPTVNDTKTYQQLVTHSNRYRVIAPRPTIPLQQPSVQPSVQQPATQSSTTAQPSVILPSPLKLPAMLPSVQTTVQPTMQPSVQPSVQTTAQPSVQSNDGSSGLSVQPATQPTVQTTAQPATQPSVQSNDGSSGLSVQPATQPVVPKTPRVYKKKTATTTAPAPATTKAPPKAKTSVTKKRASASSVVDDSPATETATSSSKRQRTPEQEVLLAKFKLQTEQLKLQRRQLEQAKDNNVFINQ